MTRGSDPFSNVYDASEATADDPGRENMIYPSIAFGGLLMVIFATGFRMMNKLPPPGPDEPRGNFIADRYRRAAVPVFFLLGGSLVSVGVVGQLVLSMGQ